MFSKIVRFHDGRTVFEYDDSIYIFQVTVREGFVVIVCLPFDTAVLPEKKIGGIA